MITDTLTEMYVQCINVECAHTWKSHNVVIHSIGPSMTPRCGLKIPFVPRSKRTDLVGAASDQMQIPGLEAPNPRAMALDTG